jgi:hypothetical protein
MSLSYREFAGNGEFIRQSIPFGSVNPNTLVTASTTKIDEGENQ